MPDIVVFGTGDMSEVVSVYIRAEAPDMRIVGYVVDDAFCTSDSHNGLPLVAWSKLETYFPADTVQLFGPLTYQRMNTVRRDRYLEGKARGYSFARFIHPDCNNYAERIGENCLILERNTLQPFSQIGDNCILWSGNHIGHHVRVGDHVFISSQVGIAGSAVIGDECHLGGQIGIAHGLTVGARSAVLNGAFISRNLPEGAVVVGNAPETRPFDSARLAKLL